MKKKLVPWSIQNHRSSNAALDFHPTMYSPISDHDDILASWKNAAQEVYGMLFNG